MTYGDDPRLTEARNPRTKRIDRVDTDEIVRMIQGEDRRVPDAVEAVSGEVAELVDRVAARLRRGGRLFYAGAGTSGRLGVLDAAECPPTFGTDPELVQGLIAGGRESLTRSREGVEDDREAGRRAVAESGVGRDDFLLGIASSGTTPWVQSAVEEAADRGAGTGFLSCTEPPDRVREIVDVLVMPLVGPEVIAGSTRMKAGTATKLVLNTLSTAVMVQLGKVYENLMVDLQAVSRKLVDRGIRIVSHLTPADRSRARRLIRDAGGSVKTALAMEMAGVDRAVAERLLDAEDGRLRRVVERFGVDGEAAGGSRGSGAPVPYYACYDPEPSGPYGIRRLLEALERGPERIVRALREPGDCRRGDGWDPAAHVAHLLAFERGAVRERIRGVREGRLEFADWPPSDPPPGSGRPVAELVDDFRDARRETLAVLTSGADPRAGAPGSPPSAEGGGGGKRAAGEDRSSAGGALEEPLGTLLRRRFRVGDEEMTLWQFLRGVEHHVRAHALRIREHVHPALREDGHPETGGESPRRESG